MSGPPWTVARDTQRLLDHIKVEDNGCWTYTGLVDARGRGRLRWEGRSGMAAHRAAYLIFVGPIPGDLPLDHVCHNADLTCVGGNSCLHRRCVNPHHLDPVTLGENVLRGRGLCAVNARKTHCVHGHEFTPENTVLGNNGRRRTCRICAQERSRRHEAHRDRRRSMATPQPTSGVPR